MKMLEQTLISFDISKLKPVVNEIAFDLHYNRIYKQYVDDFNLANGDIAFNKAGAFLHSLYFDNIREYRSNNLPSGRALNIIDQRYGSYERFVSTLVDKASQLQGNGWIFMNHSGYVNIIPNNRIVDNVAMIIDCWEHAYILNYPNDISNYIRQTLSIINWDKVNQRIDKINTQKKDF